MPLPRTARVGRSRMVEHIIPMRELFTFADIPALWSLQTLPGLAALDREVTHQAMAIGFQNSFLIMVIAPTLAIVLTLLVGRHRTS